MTPIASTHSPETMETAILIRMLRRLVQQSVYLLTGFPIALTAFVLMITGLSLGFGMLITLIGFPIIIATIYLARGFAWVERLRLHSLMEVEPAAVVYKRTSPEAGAVRRFVSPLTDSQSWLDLVHSVTAFPLALAGWIIAVVWWSAALGGLTWVFWGWTIEVGSNNEDLPELLGFGSSYPIRALFYLAIGMLFTISLPWVIMGTSKVYGAFSSALLVTPSKHRREVDYLVEGRAASRAAEDSSFRRLERDIHDGPQQRLVRLSMDLGRAKKKAEGDSPELVRVIDDAQQQTQDTLNELRALSRGIAPPILADRGLHHALEDLAVRSAIPTSCAVELYSQRLEPHVESAVYFVVSEALTNAAKHSQATEAAVAVVPVDSGLQVTISDNGIGGAHVAKGHGLAGLTDRVRAVDGALAISSPTGGPTTIVAEVPCAL